MLKIGSTEIIESYFFKKPFRNVIKIYLLKLLYHSHFNIYDDFYNEIAKDKYKNWLILKILKMKKSIKKVF